MVFSPAAALRAFEATTGVRLQADPRESLRFKLLRRRLGLPRVEIFESTPSDRRRFGGTVTVRVQHTSEPDRGVLDRGLEPGEIERGPQTGTPLIGGSAERANVEVMWTAERADIDDAAQERWTQVTAFLHHL
jgi:hypothetical protein